MSLERPREEVAKSFFDRHSYAVAQAGFNTNGKRNRSVDASGWHPSVTPEVAQKIVAYSQKFLKVPFLHLDVGTGLGYLPLEFLRAGIQSYGVEGAADLLHPKSNYDPVTGIHEPMGPHPGSQIDRERLLLADFSKPLPSGDKLKKVFDLSTSFEVIEHVHRKDQLQFWKNLCLVSKHHLCGIHVKNEEHELHCTIVGPEGWESNFDRLGIQWKRLSDFPMQKEWDCSVFYFLTFPESLNSVKMDLGKSNRNRLADLKVKARMLRSKVKQKLKTLKSKL